MKPGWEPLLLGAILVAGCSLLPKQVEIFEAFVSRDDPTALGLAVDSCNADVSAEVEESADAVVVTVSARNDTMDDCLDSVTVRLEDPLGERTLVDGADGEPVEVRTEG